MLGNEREGLGKAVAEASRSWKFEKLHNFDWKH